MSRWVDIVRFPHEAYWTLAITPTGKCDLMKVRTFAKLALPQDGVAVTHGQNRFHRQTSQGAREEHLASRSNNRQTQKFLFFFC